MTALTVDEYQYLVAAKSVKLWRTDKCLAAVDRETLNLERRHERLDDIEHVIGRNAVQVLPVEYIDWHGRIGGRSALATRANDYYFINCLFDFLLRNCDTRR